MNIDPNHKGMHPADKRNLIIFVLVSLLIWYGFEHFVLGPRMEAAQKQQAAIEATAPQATTSPEATDKVLPRMEKLAETQRVAIASPELVGSLPVVGNRLDDISLKNYYVDLNFKTTGLFYSFANEKSSCIHISVFLPRAYNRPGSEHSLLHG